MDRRVDENRTRLTPLQIAAGGMTTATVSLFVGWPTVRLFVRGLTAGSLHEVLTTSRYQRIIGFTITQAILSTIITLGLALPAAWLVGNKHFTGRRTLTSVWSATFTLPTVVVGSAFLTLFPSPLNRSVFSIICAHVFFNVGMATRLIGDAWARVDPRLDEAAATLGAPPRAVRAMVVRGPLRSAVASTAGLVLALCLTSFGIIVILGGPTRSTTETEIWRQATEQLQLGRAAGLSVVQLVIVGTVLAVTTTQSRRAPQTTQQVDRRTPLQRAERGVALSVCALMTLVVATPLGVLVRDSLRRASDGWSLAAYRSLDTTRPGNGLLDSPITSVVRSATSAILATTVAVALLLVAITGTRGRIAAAITGLPIAVSGAILGFGSLLAFSHEPLRWRAAWWLVPVMQGMVAFPYAMRAFRPAVDELDPRLSFVASTLGAPPTSVWWRVRTRLLLKPFIAASALAAAVAIGEFGVTSFLVRPKRETIPVVIATLSSRPGQLLQAQAQALAVILSILTILLVALSSATWPSARSTRAA
jgi:thiamine transport system permease protein